jgi:branched-chain amino acid transport system ATP-binding protein
MNAIETRGLGKRYRRTWAVRDCHLTVPAGQVTALVGPNGAGKTTLFALLSGFLRPGAGRVQYLGRDITGMAPHESARLGLTRTFQIVQPFGAQTVRENIAVGAHLHLPGRREALAAAEEVAARVNLHDRLDQPAADLTVGGRKRLELARALATKPRLLLLDEVLAGLNPSEIDEMIPVIRGLVDSGVTVLMIEHVMRAVMSLAEHVWVLAQGRLIAGGTPREVTSDSAVIEAYLGHGTAERLAREGGHS